MKRYLLISAVFLTKICAGQSGNSDTLCFPVPVIQKVLIAASQKKAADSMLAIAERQLSQLQSQIDLLGEKDKEQKEFYRAQMDNLQQQIAVYKDQINGYEKLYRKERRKRRVVTFAGILTTGAAVFLSLKK